jgi:alkylation response protein AidB-like acyl-CoA dehydrogenase
VRLNGYKFYSTGALFADVIAVSAIDAEGRDLQAIVPADRAGVELFDDWDGFGQRLTASGGTRFTDVEAYKAYAAGNNAVNATWPPANVYF